MTPQDFRTLVMEKAFKLLDPSLDSIEAEALLMAWAGQESDWTWRIQLGGGPGRSLFQFEATSLGAAVTSHDELAAMIARYYLRCDPHPVPAVDDEEGAWQCYLRVARPGRPDRQRWSLIYPQVMQVIKGG